MNRQDMIHEIDERFRQSGRLFNEVQRRHWAATEALKLGHGGITIVSQALRISPTTIRKGIQEIATGQSDAHSHANPRIRKPGGGRKSKQTSPDQLAAPNSTVRDPDPTERGL